MSLMTRLVTLSVFLICISKTSSLCQTDYSQLDSLINSIEEYNNSYYENIYVHTNKETYQPGESIWFKAYVTGTSNLSSNSKSLFTQLYDSAKNLIGIERHLIVNGVSTGNFNLNANQTSGAYYLVFSTHKSKVTSNAFTKLIAINNFKSPKDIVFNKLGKSGPQISKPKRLMLTSKNDSLVIRYTTSTHGNYHILLQVNGELLLANTQSGDMKVSVPFDIIPKGIATVYCFDRDNKLLEKTSLSVKSNQKSNTVVIANKQSRSEQLSYTFELKNTYGNPLRGHLSASLYLKELNPNYGEEENIVAYSSTREDVYIEDINDSLIRDNVNDKYVISGKVSSLPKKYEAVKVSAVDIDQRKLYEKTIDNKGEFEIEINEEDKNREFIVGANYKDKPLDIILYDSVKHDFFPTQFNDNSTSLPIPKNQDPSKKQFQEIKDYLDHQILPEIVVSAKRTPPEKKDTVNHTKLFSYLSNIKVEEITKDRLNILAGDDLLSILENYTSFALIKDLPGSRQLFFYKSFISLLFPPPIMFVVNGYSRGTNFLHLRDLDVRSIRSIRIINNMSAVIQFGAEAYGGVILIDTEDFVSEATKLKYTVNESKIKTSSYYKIRKPFKPSSNLESCILWEDHIRPNDYGKFILSFKKPEIPGTLILKIEGIDSNLNFVSFTKEIKIQNF